MIHAISTGEVQITRRWVQGKGNGLGRLANTLFDNERTDWLPIWCFVIEHEVGLIVIDTGIVENANAPLYFPPYMPLLQRAAKFRITREQEIDQQMQLRGLDLHAVRYVVLTHLHQDHDGGLHHFPNAEFIVSQSEWDTAKGFSGRMGGYLNHRWPDFFQPTTIHYEDGAFGTFPNSYYLTDDIVLVPTPGHSAGHQSVIYRHQDMQVIFAGDAAYTETALINGTLDGISADLDAAAHSMQRLRDTMDLQPSIVLPSHDPAAENRLGTLASEVAYSLP